MTSASKNYRCGALDANPEAPPLEQLRTGGEVDEATRGLDELPEPLDLESGQEPPSAVLAGFVPMNAERITYVDSSALVKLVVREPESNAPRQYLRRRCPLVTSALAQADVTRAVLPLGEVALRQVRKVLARIAVVRVNSRVLTIAGTLEPQALRTLGAIHLATASLFGDSLARLVCYDERMASAAEAPGWPIDTPS